MALGKKGAIYVIAASLLAAIGGCGSGTGDSQGTVEKAQGGKPIGAVSETGQTKTIPPNLTPKQQDVLRSTKGGGDP